MVTDMWKIEAIEPWTDEAPKSAIGAPGEWNGELVERILEV
jgi:hypothetical protein